MRIGPAQRRRFLMLFTQTRHAATVNARASARAKIVEQTEHAPDLMAKALTQHPERTLSLLWNSQVLEDVTDILLSKGMVQALWHAATCATGHKQAREVIKNLAFSCDR